MEKEPLRAEHGLDTAKSTPSKIQIGGEPLFFIYKDANGIEMKIANVNNPHICKKEGIIEVECIKKSNTIEPKYSISNVFDSELGMWFGVIMGWDSRAKDLRWKRFSIGDRRTYDLSKHSDRVEWSVMSRSTRLVGSPYAKGKPLYRVYDRDAEAKEIIAKSTIRSKAMEIATNDIAIEEMMDIYRCFGRNPEGFSPVRLKAELIKIAERSPKEFYDAWHNKNRGVVIIFNRCLSLGLISGSASGYMWKDSLPLGMTEQAAMDYLISHPSVLNQADLESKSRDVYRNKFNQMSSREKDFWGDAPGEEDPELVELHMAAKLMKIDGFRNMTKDQLQKLVDEASAGG